VQSAAECGGAVDGTAQHPSPCCCMPHMRFISSSALAIAVHMHYTAGAIPPCFDAHELVFQASPTIGCEPCRAPPQLITLHIRPSSTLLFTVYAHHYSLIARALQFHQLVKSVVYVDFNSELCSWYSLGATGSTDGLFASWQIRSHRHIACLLRYISQRGRQSAGAICCSSTLRIAVHCTYAKGCSSLILTSCRQ